MRRRRQVLRQDRPVRVTDADCGLFSPYDRDKINIQEEAGIADRLKITGTGKDVGVVGMTDKQYKGMLMDERLQWMEVLRMAKEDGNARIADKAKEQIDLIDEKLKA